MVDPREWSPRGDLEQEMRKLIKWLDKSGQSEAISIGRVLESAMDEDDFDYGLAIAILDQFEWWAWAARKKLKESRLE